MIENTFCLRCFRSLDKKDSVTASLWVQMCTAVDLRDNLIGIKLNNNITCELETLEEEGFILTHETDECLVVRVNGMNKYPDYPKCCINRREHFSCEKV